MTEIPDSLAIVGEEYTLDTSQYFTHSSGLDIKYNARGFPANSGLAIDPTTGPN